MFLEQQARHVRHRRLAIVREYDAVDDREVDIGVITSDDLHDGRLRKADADDEVIPALGECAQLGEAFGDAGRVGRPNHHLSLKKISKNRT